jgi:hypothetical protein
MIEFNLYDVPKEMTLYDFCNVCKLPYEGSVEEPHPSDVEEFINEVTVGERRKVSEARVASLHFPVLRYYSLFAGRCLIGHGESGGLSAPYLAILHHALLRDKTSSLGARVLFLEVSSPLDLLDALRYPLGIMRKRRNCYPLYT